MISNAPHWPQGKARFSVKSGMIWDHLAIGVNDINHACEELRSKGGKIVREPDPMKHSESDIAFVEDPNGYKIELINLSRKTQLKS